MPSVKDIKVLVVDDSITVRTMMKRQLQDAGIENIAEAKNGNEALEVFAEFLPELMFLDINMPEKNGVQVLTEIMKTHPETFVVILSSLGTKEKISETLELGAKNFLMKPVDDENLSRILNEVTSL